MGRVGRGVVGGWGGEEWGVVAFARSASGARAGASEPTGSASWWAEGGGVTRCGRRRLGGPARGGRYRHGTGWVLNYPYLSRLGIGRRLF